MDSKVFNDSYFIPELLNRDEDKVYNETENVRVVIDLCSDLVSRKGCALVITEPGYGARTALNIFIRQTRYRYYFSDCSGKKSIKVVLQEFLYLDLPGFVKFNNSTPTSLVDSLIYLFNNDPKKKKTKRIIILYGLEHLSDNNIALIQRLADGVKDRVGFIALCNDTFYKKAIRKSNTNSAYNKFTSLFKSYTLEPPHGKELEKHCVSRGVVHSKIIEHLLKKSSDFRALNRHINDLKAKLEEKGFIKINASEDSRQ